MMGDLLVKLWPTSTPNTAPVPLAQVAPAVPPIIAPTVLTTLAPGLPEADQWATAISTACARYEITTSTRLAAFLAQVFFESGYLRNTVENLNYSAAGLLATFPTHFTSDEAASYARNPERIANRVYANRMGNGSEASGDGWAYRGRGLIQITGRANFVLLAAAMKMTLADVAAYLATKEGAAMSAGWFWDQHGLNALADTDQFTAITQRINGGTNGLVERKVLWARAKAALAA